MDERALREGTAKARRSGSLDVERGAVEYEVRGAGPSVLLLHGAVAHGLFDETAAAIADEFTVVTCAVGERCTRSRGGGPAASVQRYAGDAAALVGSLDLDPVAVYGHDGAATVVLELVIWHPALVRGAVLHEPRLVTVLEDPGAAIAQLDSALRRAEGGTQAMYAAFVRAQDPALWAPRHAALRHRLLANAARFTAAEVEVFAGYRPDETRLCRTLLPLLLVQGSDTTAHDREANAWVADRARAAMVEIPGGHWTFLAAAGPFVDVIRPFLRDVTHQRTRRNPRS